jgi:UDP-N-acetylglucosamine 2-epimerase (non-hydrolysing)
MNRVFFEQLKLPTPRYNLEVGSGSHAEETGRMLIGIEKILVEEEPDVVLVEGDTNSVLAGALAASKLLIKVGHVEAGLRSYDRTMPEELNRVLTDHSCDYLFAPTVVARRNLLAEGIGEEKIFVTGNTIVDAVHQNLELARDNRIASELQLREEGYFLVTLHRQENVDNPGRLRDLVRGLELLSKRFDKTVIYPIHPRTKRRLQQFNISVRGERVKAIEPLDYLSFLKLESEADLILTDSGGVQEEACILRVPCVTLRYNTERPETIEVGANILAGTKPESIVEKASTMLAGNRDWKNPLGDGKASERIVSLLLQRRRSEARVDAKRSWGKDG